MFIYYFYWLFITEFAFICCQDLSPIVTLEDGQVRGTVNRTVGLGKTYYAYRGIPFAKKPIDNLRFASPVKNDAWNGVLNATYDKDEYTQLNVLSNLTSDVTGSEDCLYINVYTTKFNANLPVMVWIYGGTLVSGSSAYRNGGPDYLLDEDIIFVSFNYRLGVFGFLSTEDNAATGNWGLKDQLLALKWVQTNIKHFGGDSNKVTIFGESAGAASISYIIDSKLSKGLFAGAIMQSGTSLCLLTLSRDPRKKAFDVGKKLNIKTTNSTKNLIDSLRKVDYRKLKVAEISVTLSYIPDIFSGLPFAVVQEPDHDNAILSDRSYKLLSTGDFNRVPLIIGYNSLEIKGIPSDLPLPFLLLSQIMLSVPKLAPYDLTGNILLRFLAGKIIRVYYFGLDLVIDPHSTQVSKFLSVDQFGRPIRKTVELMSKYTNVYYYKFSYEGKLGNPNRTSPGVGHAEDVNYLFYLGNITVSPEDALTRKKLVTLWTNFAKFLNPTPTTTSDILQNTTWIPNTKLNQTNVYYLNINKTLSNEINPDQADWNFYSQIIYGVFGNESYYTTY
ncbi:pyrethroid hydrolase Ces2a-like [Sitophilus oryzae]|uniref:Carboxylic ester hydrolase n=1 Tax=Sitophilus oryzae TaxID=7048 RepID=A0A6J2YIK2_SITOR|nr:pyrethroid hydrolase Ces2a-like [Sitophilus oryzae]